MAWENQQSSKYSILHLYYKYFRKNLEMITMVTSDGARIFATRTIICIKSTVFFSLMHAIDQAAGRLVWTNSVIQPFSKSLLYNNKLQADISSWLTFRLSGVFFRPNMRFSFFYLALCLNLCLGSCELFSTSNRVQYIHYFCNHKRFGYDFKIRINQK